MSPGQTDVNLAQNNNSQYSALLKKKISYDVQIKKL
uniref:Uncharacterized protein n=1 Tax=Arundo donax TaxID=35708 RepID=A0A0A9BYL3_ARUDO